MKAKTEKMIATSKRRIEEFKAKIEKYEAAKNKALAAVGLTEDDFTAKIERGYGDVTAKDKHLYEKIGFDKEMRIVHNWQYKLNNEYDLKREEEHLESLLAIAAEEDQAESKEKQLENLSKHLEKALRKSLEEFKTSWFEKMMNWHNDYFDRAMVRVPELQAMQKRLNTMFYYFFLRRGHDRLSRRISGHRDLVERWIASYGDAWYYRNDKPAYMNKAQKSLEREWESNIKTLTKKCYDFKLNNKLIEVSQTAVTEKGFEAYITDGSNRRVYARLIWAAEYSDYVSPHVRYIITEKQI